MKSSDRTILVVLPLLALAIGFWMLVIGPKRSEVSDLDKEVSTLQADIDAAESELAVAEQARAAFPKSYARLVSLGAAVPEDDDQATFVHDLSELARRDDVSFRSFLVSPATDVSAPAAPAATTPADPAAEAPAGEEATTTAAPATEAAAATLPLGATVGPAGLPVTPYNLKYFGDFFDTANLFAALDARVDVGDGTRAPKVSGRLITIDGFAMSADPVRGFPRVETEVAVTTYLVPAEQGLSAGATPAGPPPVSAPPTTVAGTPDPAAGTTAAVTP